MDALAEWGVTALLLLLGLAFMWVRIRATTHVPAGVGARGSSGSSSGASNTPGTSTISSAVAEREAASTSASPAPNLRGKGGKAGGDAQNRISAPTSASASASASASTPGGPVHSTADDLRSASRQGDEGSEGKMTKTAAKTATKTTATTTATTTKKTAANVSKESTDATSDDATSETKSGAAAAAAAAAAATPTTTSGAKGTAGSNGWFNGVQSMAGKIMDAEAASQPAVAVRVAIARGGKKGVKGAKGGAKGVEGVVGAREGGDFVPEMRSMNTMDDVMQWDEGTRGDPFCQASVPAARARLGKAPVHSPSYTFIAIFTHLYSSTPVIHIYILSITYRHLTHTSKHPIYALNTLKYTTT